MTRQKKITVYLLLWYQTKRGKGYKWPQSPNPSSNTHKKNMTRQKNKQNLSLCTPLVPNKERQCSLDKRQRFCCDDHADCITSYSLNNISIQKMYYCLAYFQCNLQSYRSRVVFVKIVRLFSGIVI